MFHQQELTLAKAESVPVLIQFDPSYNEDSVTRTAESFLKVSFGDHPQKVVNHVLCYFPIIDEYL